MFGYEVGIINREGKLECAHWKGCLLGKYGSQDGAETIAKTLDEGFGYAITDLTTGGTVFGGVSRQGGAL